MTQYVLVGENGDILDGPRYLPINWNNISNFNCLDDVTLLNYGWKPHEFISFDITDKVVIGSSWNVEGDKVTEHQLVRDKTSSEITDKINATWQSIRAQRDIYLM